MQISDILGSNVAILGFGIEGRSVLAELRRRGHQPPVHVVTRDAVSVPDGVLHHIATDTFPELPQLDVVIRSPGFAPQHPLRKQVDALGVAQTTATRLFLREVRALDLPLIGITGSKGKSTTSTLTQLALDKAGVPCVLVGNVGVSALDVLARASSERLTIVMELSSYQCADLEQDFGPSSAGLLDLFPEHLDWHGSLGAYYAAKLRIIEAQCATDVARYNEQSGASASFLSRLPKRALAMNTAHGLHYANGWFRRGSEALFSDAGMRLLGLHNRRNAVAALALSELAGARPEHLQQVLSEFAGLPFRLQREGLAAGIHWINDAISTAPEAVTAALSALANELHVSTLIVGGQSRGLDQALLANALSRSSVRTLIALPDTGSDVARGVRAMQLEIRLLETDTLETAVQLAVNNTSSGEACLYSPGAPSYNRYTSFTERGLEFRRLIHALDARAPAGPTQPR